MGDGKVLLLLPFVCDSKMHKYLRNFIPSEVDIRGLEKGRVTETKGDAALTLPEEIRAIVKAERDGYDAVVIGCHGDPGVEEAREFVDIAVFGVMNVALHVCAMVGDRICIFTPSQTIKKWIQRNITAYGFESRVSVRQANYTVREAISQYWRFKESGKRGSLIKTLVEESIDAIENDNVTVLTIGCGGLLWAVDLIRDELKKRGYDIPFINPIPVAIDVIGALARRGVTHSRLSYPGFKEGYDGL